MGSDPAAEAKRLALFPGWPDGEEGKVLLDVVLDQPVDAAFLLLFGGLNDLRVRPASPAAVINVAARASRPHGQQQCGGTGSCGTAASSTAYQWVLTLTL